MTKPELERELQKLRNKYRSARNNWDRSGIATEAAKIQSRLSMLCRECQYEEIKLRFTPACSQECKAILDMKDKSKKKVQPTTGEMRKRLLEIKKRAHLNANTEKNGQIRLIPKGGWFE